MAIYRGGGQTTSKRVVMRVLEVKRKNLPRGGQVCCGRGAGPSRSVDHPTLCCLLWLRDNGPLPGGGKRDAQPEPDTGSSQSYTKQTAELWHSCPPPHSRKTISTVIKGELNRLISSKVTERPSLSSPFTSSFPSFSPRSSVTPARWRPSMKCHQISGGVRGHRTKMFR